ncbi:manganese catalase family protein [Desulfosporosinus sp. FKA]|uniref:ferritin-like domain-containing protein n=1 Tax=Desulfosporosinus sp. FKA TaxID=1969834 RepID=UPI000B49D7D5|nr:manganese catalase family protein [Desulfosporosinus sp. FKA]
MSETNYERHKRGEYSDPSPYPEVKVLRPNLRYAEILMDDYAGIVSEFSAISQYLYHHFLFDQIDKELGDLLKNVSIAEMLHMEILADTIIKLGGNPGIRGSKSSLQGNFWSGKFIYYGTNLCEQLKADIDAEYKAIEEYQKHIRYIEDFHVQAILQRIILDEKVHICLFSKALQKYCGSEYSGKTTD